MTPIAELNPAQMIREACRLCDRLQSDVAKEVGNGLVRVLDSVPEQHIEQIMATPLRRAVLDAVFWAAPHALDDTRAGDVITSLRCHVTGRPDGSYDAYWLEYAEGRWRSGRGATGNDPELTITLDSSELLRLVVGRSHPVHSYLRGRLQLSGNQLLVTRLTMLVRAVVTTQARPRPS